MCVFSIISYVIELSTTLVVPKNVSVVRERDSFKREDLSARALHYENFSLFLFITNIFPSMPLYVGTGEEVPTLKTCFESVTVVIHPLSLLDFGIYDTAEKNKHKKSTQ